MNRRTLQKHGYTIKHTIVGWWVDGACGYNVASVCDSEQEAINAASAAITAAKQSGSRPCWMFDNR
jgi:formylmethanofuran:tetrahydromethanopterin formyltransferase